MNISNLEKVCESGSERTTAIEDLGFEVEGGEFVRMVEPSGCGKSTLLYLVAGFLDVSSGTIEVDGPVVEGPRTDRGVVFQEYALFPWRTVMGNVTYGLEAAVKSVVGFCQFGPGTSRRAPFGHDSVAVTSVPDPIRFFRDRGRSKRRASENALGSLRALTGEVC